MEHYDLSQQAQAVEQGGRNKGEGDETRVRKIQEGRRWELPEEGEDVTAIGLLYGTQTEHLMSPRSLGMMRHQRALEEVDNLVPREVNGGCYGTANVRAAPGAKANFLKGNRLYATDVLRVENTNLRPGDKQAYYGGASRTAKGCHS